ncbi:xylosidase arabinofuranosidase [Phlyctema vagabunda]|uniref:Xylosidase arabinofuranosidase n=1 Tax=Phlyctema vagabunda TaxID=108571 RepID=A0ABR4P1Q8_9HELO
MQIVSFIFYLVFFGLVGAIAMAGNSSYTNPILPGWHSDPSCIYVKEHDTFFCVTSSFLAFPGLPLYASKDLINWRLSSNVFSRQDQVPQIASLQNQQAGIWAATIRYHKGTFYVITASIDLTPWSITGLIFTSTDPYNNEAWNDPIVFDTDEIDPDIFWDDDGQVYISSGNGAQSKFDFETGSLGPKYTIWNGTGERNPEGPHIYKKDGYYYVLFAEGGTELGHVATIARSKTVSGPYESYAGNPILTNRNTTEYFQTVGHADLFEDGSGNWWGVALATRSGPEWTNYPMGRETVLYPVTWETGEWPVLQPVRGRMGGNLPAPDRNITGVGQFVEDPDKIDFTPGSSLPGHLVSWRFPAPGTFEISPDGHPNTLSIKPSRANLTSSPDSLEQISLIMRRQIHTLFTFKVNISFDPKTVGAETGVVAFLTQQQHIDLGVVLLSQDTPRGTTSTAPVPHLKFQATGTDKDNGTVPATVLRPIPESWYGSPITFQIQAVNDTHFTFAAGPSSNSSRLEVLGTAPSSILSGGTGPFTGTLLGVYATTNGDNSTQDLAFITKWRYEGQAQAVASGEYVPAKC